MKTAFLPAYEFGEGPVPLSIVQHNGKTLIECDSGDVILYYLHGRTERFDRLKFTRIRGVCIPGEGAYFELFDRFGRMLVKPFTFSIECVQERLLGGVIWEVPVGAF